MIRDTLYKVGDGEVDLDDAITSLSAVIAVYLSIHPIARSPEGLDRMVDSIAREIRILATKFIVTAAS